MVTQLGDYPNSQPIAFIANEGLVRLCTEDYHPPEQTNLHNLLSHLTNYSLNKLSEKFVKSEDLDEANIEQASKRPLSSVLEMLKIEQGVDTDYLFEQIIEVVQKSLVALQPQGILEQEAIFSGRFNEKKGDCFQILGFDIFIDRQLKAWVLEINDHPSLNILATREGAKGLEKEPSEVDKYIKVKVVGDAIKLMSKKKYKNDRSQIDKSGCWHRILPSVDMEGEFESFIKAKYIFERLLNRKGAKQMSLSAFSKLSKIKVLQSKI